MKTQAKWLFLPFLGLFLLSGPACTGESNDAPAPKGAGGAGGDEKNAKGLSISPSQAVLRAGETLQFVAKPTDALRDQGVSWSATGGSITEEGLYTAPSEPGTYEIRALSLADEGVAATAEVTVPVAKTLVYEAPPSTGWRLAVNAAASTPGRLVLDLFGPAGERGHGVALTLAVDPARASWQPMDESAYLATKAFAPGDESRLVESAVDGGTLRLGAFQKGARAAPIPYDGALLSIALSLKADPTLAAGVPIDLAVPKAHIRNAAGAMEEVEVQLGTLRSD